MAMPSWRGYCCTPPPPLGGAEGGGAVSPVSSPRFSNGSGPGGGRRVDRRLGLDDSTSRSSSQHGRPSLGLISESENIAPAYYLRQQHQAAQSFCTPVREPAWVGGSGDDGGALAEYPVNHLPECAAVAATPAAVTENGGGGRVSSGDAAPALSSSQFCTPRVSSTTLELRARLDTVLDASNADHRHDLPPPVTTLIEGQLYLGGNPDAAVLQVLEAEGVRCIINCCPQDCPPSDELRAGWWICEIPTYDRPDYYILLHDLPHFEHQLSAALAAGERVYVHCIAGINRSVTLCAAYLMDRFLLTPAAVVQLFHSSGRLRILENTGFRQQLIDHYLQSVEPRLS